MLDDSRFLQNANVTIKIDKPLGPFQLCCTRARHMHTPLALAVCELADKDLADIIWRRTSVMLINIEARITFDGMRKIIDKWTTAEKPITSWKFEIRYDMRDEDAVVYFRRLLIGLESRVEEVEPWSRPKGVRCVVVHKKTPCRRFVLVVYPNSDETSLWQVCLSEYLLMS